MEVHGFTAPGFERVRAVFAANFAEGGELGAGFAAIAAGEVLVELWGGHADRARTQPWTQTTLAPVFSTTKAVAALVAARLVGQGLLDYDAPVASIWPDFAAYGKDALTLAETLAHGAGIPGFPEPIDPELWFDPPAAAAAIAELTPLWPPGSASGYHPVVWGYIVGEIVRRAAGRSLGQILAEEICRPAGIDFHIGLPETERPRIADIRKPTAPADLGALTDIKRVAFGTSWWTARLADPRWAAIEIPSTNGHGTALAVAQLYAAYAENGWISGREIIAAEAFEQLIQIRFTGLDLVLPFDIAWGAGVMANSFGAFGPNRAAYGHPGAGGSCGFGDPARRLSVGYVMNQQSSHLAKDPRPLRLIAALYDCL